MLRLISKLMKTGTVRAGAAIGFSAAGEALRPVAGIPVAARIVRELARAGFGEAWIEVSSGEPLDPLLLAEIHRLAPGMTVHVGPPPVAADVMRFPSDRLIADIVNKAHPGWGKSVVLPGSDHLFHNFATEAESLKNFRSGKFNPVFIRMTKDWIDAVMASND